MTTLSAGFLNRALERESWARERLAMHAGRSFTVAAGPLQQSFLIMANGQLDTPEHGSGMTDLLLRVSPLRLPSLLAQPQRWNDCVTATGDAALASTISELAQTLPWFIEAMWTRALGPVAGTRAADFGRRVLEFPAQAAERFSASVSAYAREEAAPRYGLTRDETQAFSDAVAAVAERTDALEQRIERLAAEPTTVSTP
jgi:ubiquinone biosynthesis protein UbiJ